jgi:hypothetical protein
MEVMINDFLRQSLFIEVHLRNGSVIEGDYVDVEIDEGDSPEEFTSLQIRIDEAKNNVRSFSRSEIVKIVSFFSNRTSTLEYGLV